MGRREARPTPLPQNVRWTWAGWQSGDTVSGIYRPTPEARRDFSAAALGVTGGETGFSWDVSGYASALISGAATSNQDVSVRIRAFRTYDP